MLQSGMHIHLVGIGGAGLSAIARVLLGSGYKVSGSDQTASELTEQLASEGATVFLGHSPGNIAGAHLVLVSSAVPPENPEVLAAQAAGVPVAKRDVFLPHLMEGKVGVAVAGAHGKTTTTAMLVSILMEAGYDPSFVVGGVLSSLGTNAHAGRGDLFVIEADEYDRMFLGLRLAAAVVTIVEHDHPDCYPTAQCTMEAFRQFVRSLPRDGMLVACASDDGARELARERMADGGSVRLYGLSRGLEWRATDIRPNQAGGSDFVVVRQGSDSAALVRLRVPGRHNVLNALGALALADWLGVPFAAARTALAEFRGVGRRFETVGEALGITVIDDYAHHPTEVAATLAAARERYPGRRVWAVFQPHTYSRTRELLERFAVSFDDADQVVVLDIYPAREVDTLGISSMDLVARMDPEHARYVPERHEAAELLATWLQPGDVLITLGAGDGYMVGRWVLAALRQQKTKKVESGGLDGSLFVA